VSDQRAQTVWAVSWEFAMARTATHAARRGRHHIDIGTPLVLFDLRFQRAPARTGTRRVPRPVRRTVRFDRYERAYETATGGWWARHQIGGARAALRDRLVALRQVANGPGGAAALDDLDVAPYRPRHDGLWQSW
jgi:hypothetical protein